MSTNNTGFIRFRDYSNDLANFTRKHESFGKYPIVSNADVSAYHDFEIHTLHRLDDDGDRVTTPVLPAVLGYVKDVINWVLTESINGTLSSNSQTVQAELDSRFNTAVFNVTTSTIKADADNKLLPKYLNFTYDDTVQENFKLWLDPVDFEDNYNNYDVVVFGEFDQVDDMLNDKATLTNIINNFSNEDYLNALNNIGDDAPYTGVTRMEVEWVNKDNAFETMKVNFHFACYGPVMDSELVLRQAIRKWVEDNTAVSTSIWEVVLPTIFTSTTFTLIPVWDSKADLTIYNPIVNINKNMEIFKNRLTGYNGSFLNDNYESLPVMWQSLFIGTCGSPNNVVGNTSISVNLPDYILVDPSSPDFIRLSSTTKDFIVKLNNVLPYAETYTDGGNIPVGVNLEIIDNLKFLVFTSFNLKCKVLVKEDYLTVV